MKYDALEVARYILSYCYSCDFPISNLRLQKMLYFIQGEFYEKTGNPLFHNDICAWQFGPVVPDVYYEYCVYAGTPILEECETNIDSRDTRVIEHVIDRMRDIPTWELVNITHSEGTPWHQVFNDQGNRSVIPPSILRSYFYNCEGTY